MYILYNNFPILVSVTMLHLATCENCDKNGVLLYEEIGCTPVKSENDHCPSSYNCDLSHAKSGCLFKGRIYGAGEEIDSNLTFSGCSVGCECTETNNVECAALDCPEFYEDQKDPNCYPEYTLGQCCSTGKICTGSSKTCKVDGNTYKIGEQFYPKNTCLSCVCHEKFTGIFEIDSKTCIKHNCNTQIPYPTQIGKKCAPAYFKSDSDEALCCPDDFVCPDGTENLDKPAANTSSQNGKECLYGEKKVKSGQYFEKTVNKYGKDRHLKCECILPPLVTCKEV